MISYIYATHLLVDWSENKLQKIFQNLNILNLSTIIS